MTPLTANHHVVVAAVTAALSLGAALAGCSAPQAAAAPAEAAEPLAVHTARAAMTQVAAAIESGGVVQARTTATIAARILAPVREVRVAPGDLVRAGQALVVLDGADLAAGARAARSAALAADQGAMAAAAELRAAEAALDLARASHDRIAGLHDKGSATAQERDDATASLRSAAAHVAGASARARQAALGVESARAVSDHAATTQSFTTLAAPFDGMVTEKMVEPGNMASPGLPLLRLEDTRAFRLEVRVDQSRVGEVRDGDDVPVVLGTATTAIHGTVVEISRAIDADARAFLVKIELPGGPGVRSGEFGKARFGGPPRRALTIPSSAIVRRGQLASVFVVDRGVAALRLLHLGESPTPSQTEVLAGLTESEVVVLSPPAGLTDGRRVRVGGR